MPSSFSPIPFSTEIPQMQKGCTDVSWSHISATECCQNTSAAENKPSCTCLITETVPEISKRRKAGCAVIAVSMGWTAHSTEQWCSTDQAAEDNLGCRKRDSSRSIGKVLQKDRHLWLNKGRAQCSWHLQKHQPEREREMRPSDFTVLVEYLPNYREPVAAASGDLSMNGKYLSLGFPFLWMESSRGWALGIPYNGRHFKQPPCPGPHFNFG